MGTDIIERVQINHPEYGWVCVDSRLDINRNYELFNLMGRDGCSKGLPPGDKCMAAAYEDEHYEGRNHLTIEELKFLLTSNDGSQSYGTIAQLVQLIADLERFKHGELTDSDVRLVFAFSR